eukprot:1161487-Pelagomonas_calceolata.AAC.2
MKEKIAIDCDMVNGRQVKIHLRRRVRGRRGQRIRKVTYYVSKVASLYPPRRRLQGQLGGNT